MLGWQVSGLEQPKKFEYDYCSVGDSASVYDDVTSFFVEAFGGYNIPMDPYTCPFHPSNLKYMRDKHHFEQWRKAKSANKAATTFKCPMDDKQFKSVDYLELHMKMFYVEDSPTSTYYKLG
jgi:hypothetical protein